MIHIAATWRVGIVQAHSPSREAEFPPDVERLFETLLARAWARPDGELHRTALRALEGNAPTIHVTPYASDGTAMHRYGRYIHSNAKINEAECAYITTPVFVDDGPHVVYSYDISDDADRDALLTDLLADVWYFGEAASSVTFRLVAEPPRPMRLFKPVRGTRSSEIQPAGTKTLRVPLQGRMDVLERSYARRTARAAGAMHTTGTIANAKTLTDEPQEALSRDLRNGTNAWIAMRDFYEIDDNIKLVRYQYYDVQNVVGGAWELQCLLLAEPQHDVDGRNFDTLLANFRSSWLDSLRCEHPALTGHEPGGTFTRRPHVGFIPILDLDRPFATGLLQGFGVLIPRDLSIELREEANAATARTVSVHGRRGRLFLVDEDTIARNDGSTASRLRIPKKARWRSQHWATVTPAIPFRYTKPSLERRDPNAALPAMLEMFDRAGLPQPTTITWSAGSKITGAPHAGSVRGNKETQKLPLPRHLVFSFAERVHGPIVLGWRAWKGYGVCLPSYSQ